MKSIYLIATLSFLSCDLTAQHPVVQWASEVVSFSTQYGKDDYSAKQVLGVPNALFNPKLHHMAWVPKKEASLLGEYIEVQFANRMKVQQVAVAESLNPGSISRIWLLDPAGKKHKVYENKAPRNLDVFQRTRLFRHYFPTTSYEVTGLRLELNTRAVQGSNQIDAIAISDSDTPIKAAVEEVKYAEKVARAEKLGPQINSPYAERLPLISPDGNTLYFARKYHPQNLGEAKKDDIWVSQRQTDDTWAKAVNLGYPLNNELHNFVIAVSPDGKQLYLANDYQRRLKDGVSFTKRLRAGWSNPQLMKIADFYNKNEFVSYHINTEGNIMLLAVERDDGFGDRDLYVCFLENDNHWSSPKNLGSTINTIGIESSVFLAADGKTIYFSSNGHVGYGGLDMFMSRRLDNSWTNWSTPKNLGEEINSKGNDYNYTIPASGAYAYFSRDDVRGMSDIYRIALPKEIQPEPVMLLSGRIIDSETQEQLPGKLQYEHLGPNAVNQNSDNVIEDGAFQLVLPFGTNVGVHAEVEGYFSVTEPLELGDDWLEEIDEDDSGIGSNIATKPESVEKPKYEERTQDILMVPIKIGQIIPMQSVFFEANEASLKDVSYSELNRVLSFLKGNPALIVEVGGHTNGWCSHEFASELSRNRARTVRDYFVRNGINENRVQYRGYGKTEPIASNDTLQGRKKNQRVELKILEILD